jgi:bile acid:Na+ symporter, BASS family
LVWAASLRCEWELTMSEMLPKLLTITVVIFMVGSLLEMGLKLRLEEAGKALRNGRFLVWSLVWGFVLCPAFALLLTKIIPLAEPYALGLLFLGMAPCAPFLPRVSEKAHGDLAYVAAFMILAAVGTVIYMPFAVPVLVKGFAADPWTIAKPLVFLVATPLAIGVVIRRAAEAFAERSHPMVKKAVGLDIIIMLALILWIYGKDDLSAIGTYAIGTQFLYYAVVGAASYGLSFGLSHGQKSAIALGLCTRNVGAALAPLLAVAGTDQRAIVMCFLAAVITIVTGFGGAHVLARFAPATEAART